MDVIASQCEHWRGNPFSYSNLYEVIMAYLITAPQRAATHSTLYFEFQKGVFHGLGKNSHWKTDSVYLHADIFDQLNLYDLFHNSISDFDYYNATQVTPEQYAVLKQNASACGADVSALFEELDMWVSKCFQTESCFTICGI